MMQDRSLDMFIEDIDDIREYIKNVCLANDVGKSNCISSDDSAIKFRNHLHKFGVAKKLFEYKAITISLYGILEKHIGLWIKEHVSRLPKLVLGYNDLSESIREDHFNLSIKLISLISENRSPKYEYTKREDVLARLNSCIENPHSYDLNSDAFYLHSGNLKHAKIVEAFKHLDINLESRLKVVGVRTGGFLIDIASNTPNRGGDLFGLIDDLVVRRNDISHGESVDNILNVTEFNDYIDFLEGYGKAVFQILVEKNNQYEAEHLYEKIKNVKAIYKTGSILCFEIENN
ncbi:hypothetical protein JYT13_01740, partial [Mariprofundus ferrooxydans]|nr:hypothetical protein [Mariprofundus ferrooxydans]